MEPENKSGSNWLPLSQILSDAGETQPDSKQLRNWALVLSARNIPFQLTPKKRPTEIYVPARFISISCFEINLYLAENSKDPSLEYRSIEPVDNVITSLSILLLLGIFHNLTYLQISGFGHSSIDWLHLGSADNIKILAGEWWRVITALTLHADVQHLLGNLLIGGYFIIQLCRITGTGLGWLLILGSGSLGNLLNAIMQNSGHNAVGASTAIFGAIGIAGALGTIRSRNRLMRLWLLPLAASGLLLAFLGTGSGDSQTDIGAHLFGFCCGVILGIPAGMIITEKGIPGRSWNIILAIIAISILGSAWLTALIK